MVQSQLKPQLSEYEPINYSPEPTIEDFHMSDAIVKGLRGPEGSGKSVGCFFDMFKYACLQEPYKGKRSTYWTVVRNNYPALLTTSLRTFEEWFGGLCIKPPTKQPPVEATVRLELPDKTIVEMMVLFLSLDVPDDVRKLKSLETTGGFLNEASEMGRWILTRLLARCGRWPPKRWGVKPVWSGVLMDTNSCEDDHWWYKAAEEDKPEGWKFFDQPAALIKFQSDKTISAYEKAKQYVADYQHLPDDFLRIVADMHDNLYVGNPMAENVKWQPLGINYWLNTISGRPMKEINTLVMNEYGPTGDDVPVYPEYMDNVHCAKDVLKPMQSIGIILGFDFGLMPACTFSQISPRGQKLFLDEMYVEKHGAMGIRQLSREYIVPYLLDNFLPWLIKGLICGYGDPAGTQRAQTDEKTCYQILRECPITNPIGGISDFRQNGKRLSDPEYFRKIREQAGKGYVSLGDIGVEITPARTNKFGTRRDAVSKLLLMRIDGDPAFLLSPKCKLLRKGFRGKYRYKRVQVGGSDDRYKDEPIKDLYSHICEAAMYDCLMSSYFAYDSTEESEQAVKAKLDALDTPSRSAANEFAAIVSKIRQEQEAMEIWF